MRSAALSHLVYLSILKSLDIIHNRYILYIERRIYEKNYKSNNIIITFLNHHNDPINNHIMVNSKEVKNERPGRKMDPRHDKIRYVN